jgi:hypothetical protein
MSILSSFRVYVCVCVCVCARMMHVCRVYIFKWYVDECVHTDCVLVKVHMWYLLQSLSTLYFLLDIFFIYLSNVIPFPGFPSETPYAMLPLPASMRVLLHLPTQSCLSALAFPYTGVSSLRRTKGVSSHWCQTRPSSATYAAWTMGSSMCTLWLVV